MIFILKIKIQNKDFSQVYCQFLTYRGVRFETLLGWESTYVCHKLRTEKQGIYIK